MRHRIRAPRRSPVAVGLLAGLLGFALVVVALGVRDARTGDRFDLLRWQLDTFPGRWVALAGRPFRETSAADEVIRAYFSHPPQDPARRALQNDLQLIVEGRLDAVLQDLGLNARLRLPGSVFPPVNIHIAEAPQVLVTSPRGIIERERVELLRPDLPLERALEIEAAAEDAETSAIVLPTGGLATYPAVVADRGTYAGLLQIAAHEWVHHYLAFYPLGIRYFVSSDLRTINETVADLVGDEVAAQVLQRWGDPTAPPERIAPPPGAVDRFGMLRELRVEVDALLAAGRVEEAEARMEVVRQEFEDAGIRIRRINQAYFAWFGTYAARPDAVDPLGQQLREIRERAGSLPAFMELARGWDSRRAVEETLRTLGDETAGVAGSEASRRLALE